MTNRVKRRLLGIAGSVMLAGGALVATAGTAEAASPCPGTHLGNWPITGGYISVYYNAATGRNCALTYTNTPGVRQYIYVSISKWSGGARDEDEGMFKYYAGPVSVYAPGQCIGIEGRVGTSGPYEGTGPLYCD
jgi:hypothetical protein